MDRARAGRLAGLTRAVRRMAAAGRTALSGRRPTPNPAPSRARPAAPSRAPAPTPEAAGRPPYPGDLSGPFRVEYAPVDDGRPDPGEVVWAWVPFEEDHTQGKDRPVLVVGHDGQWLLAAMLTSKDHDRDAAQEARAGRHWLDVGAGAWDAKRRPSEVRLDRVLRLDPAAVRRAGATLDPDQFAAVTRALIQYHR